MIRLLWKTTLLICFRYKKSFKAWKVFLLKIQKDLSHSKSFGTFSKQTPDGVWLYYDYLFFHITEFEAKCDGQPHSEIKWHRRWYPWKRRKQHARNFLRRTQLAFAAMKTGWEFYCLSCCFLTRDESNPIGLLWLPLKKGQRFAFLSHHVEANVMPQICVTWFQQTGLRVGRDSSRAVILLLQWVHLFGGSHTELWLGTIELFLISLYFTHSVLHTSLNT